MNRDDYNDLKTAIAFRDALRTLGAAALGDNMELLVQKLIECEVLPRGTRPLKPSIIHA